MNGFFRSRSMVAGLSRFLDVSEFLQVAFVSQLVWIGLSSPLCSVKFPNDCPLLPAWTFLWTFPGLLPSLSFPDHPPSLVRVGIFVAYQCCCSLSPSWLFCMSLPLDSLQVRVSALEEGLVRLNSQVEELARALAVLQIGRGPSESEWQRVSNPGIQATAPTTPLRRRFLPFLWRLSVCALFCLGVSWMDRAAQAWKGGYSARQNQEAKTIITLSPCQHLLHCAAGSWLSRTTSSAEGK